jgi:symplekin
MWVTLPPIVVEVISEQLPLLMKSIKTQGLDQIGLKNIAEKFLDLIKAAPLGSEGLVFLLCIEMSKKGLASFLPEIIIPWFPLDEKIEPNQFTRDITFPDHVRLLAPVLPHLEKKMINSYLPIVLNILQEPQYKDIFKMMIIDMVEFQKKMSPAEFMLSLHHIETSNLLKLVIEAIQMCFSLKTIYKQDVWGVVLQQLIDEPKLPILFMRTIMQAVQTYKGLTGFVVSLLPRLINKKIWKLPQLWQGFIRCAKITSPASSSVLIQLPASQFQQVLKKYPDLKPIIKDYIENQVPAGSKSSKQIQEILVIVSESSE